MDNLNICAEIKICGEVQGVGYRYFAVQHATKLGLNGCVQNCDDGSVLIMVEGKRCLLEQFIAHLNIGPAMATVVECAVKYHFMLRNYQGFKIKR